MHSQNGADSKATKREAPEVHCFIFENQWKWPSGWRDVCQSRAAGAPQEPIPPWSNAEGTQQLHPELLAAPAACSWCGEWTVDVNGDSTDEQGWRYADSVHALLRGGADTSPAPDPTWTLPVRRRRWSRAYHHAKGEGLVATAVDRESFSEKSPQNAAAHAQARQSHLHAAAKPLNISVPLRSSSDRCSFESLARDVHEYIILVDGLRRLVAMVGGHKDTRSLRGTANRLITALLPRAHALDACIQFNAADFRGDSHLSRRGAAEREASKSASASAGEASFERRRWTKLLEDCVAMRAVLASQVATFSSRIRLSPDPADAEFPPAHSRADGAPIAHPAPTGTEPSRGHLADRGAGGSRSISSVGAAGGGGNAAAIVAESRGGAGMPAPPQQQQLLLAAEVDFTSALVEERSRHIDSITGQVTEVAGLFADLRSLLAEQGQALERVEATVEGAKDSTLAGVKHLRAAERSDAESSSGCSLM